MSARFALRPTTSPPSSGISRASEARTCSSCPRAAGRPCSPPRPRGGATRGSRRGSSPRWPCRPGPASKIQSAASARRSASAASASCSGTGALLPGVSRIQTRSSSSEGSTISTWSTAVASSASCEHRLELLVAALAGRPVAPDDADPALGAPAQHVEGGGGGQDAGGRHVGADERVDERGLAGVELAEDRQEQRPVELVAERQRRAGARRRGSRCWAKRATSSIAAARSTSPVRASPERPQRVAAESRGRAADRWRRSAQPRAEQSQRVRGAGRRRWRAAPPRAPSRGSPPRRDASATAAPGSPRPSCGPRARGARRLVVRAPARRADPRCGRARSRRRGARARAARRSSSASPPRASDAVTSAWAASRAAGPAAGALGQRGQRVRAAAPRHGGARVGLGRRRDRPRPSRGRPAPARRSTVPRSAARSSSGRARAPSPTPKSASPNRAAVSSSSAASSMDAGDGRRLRPAPGRGQRLGQLGAQRIVVRAATRSPCAARGPRGPGGPDAARPWRG